MRNKNADAGTGFVGLLLLAFIILKLCQVIKWSWWWVLSPIWIIPGLGLILVLLDFINPEKERGSSVDRHGHLKSKWQERMEQMQEAKRQQEQKRNEQK